MAEKKTTTKKIPRTTNNVSPETAKKNVPDIIISVNLDCWKLISKASSKNEGWFHSTKGMQIGQRSVMVQTFYCDKNGSSQGLCEIVGTLVKQQDGTYKIEK